MLYIVETTDGKTCYTLVKQEETLLTKNFTVESNIEGKIANINCKHILFEKVNMPKLEVSCKDGESFIVRKEMEQLVYTVKVYDGELAISGDVYSNKFELIHKGNTIAILKCDKENVLISVDDENESLAVTVALAIEVAK